MNQEPKHIKAKPDEIVFSLTNPRRHGGDFTKRPDWPEFLDSVRQHGVKQWPLVRLLPAARTDAAAKGKKYELIAGDRRTTAAQVLKLPEINLVLETLDDAKVVEIQQIENLQREDLSALEEAQGYADWRDSLIKAGAVKTVEEAVAHICTKINRKRSAVFGKLALVKTSPKVQEALKSGRLDTSKAQLIAQIPDATKQGAALKAVEERNLSFRQLQEHIEALYRISLKNAPFDQTTTFLKLPTCAACPHRTGNMAIEGTDPHVCTKPECFREKCTITAGSSAEKIAGMLSEATWKKVQYNSEYLNEGETCYADDKRRTWKVILGKLAPPVYLTIARDYGSNLELRRLYKKADVDKIVKEHALLKPPGKRKPSKEELEQEKAVAARREAQKKKEEALSAARIQAVLASSNDYNRERQMPFTFWKALAKSVVLGHAYELDESIFTGRNLQQQLTAKEGHSVEAEILFAYIDRQTTPHNLIGLIVDVCAAGLGTWADDGGDLNKLLLFWGVDWRKKPKPTNTKTAGKAGKKGTKK